jgi:hypothetical protein
MLAAIGMERSPSVRHEVLATGGQVRKRTVETRDELTAQEEQIARLARDGLSTPEIGAPAVPQPAHGRIAPQEGVHQARIRSRDQGT